MPDILHDFPIAAPASRVFRAVSTPADLDQWWTKRSSGNPTKGAEWELWFGPEYDWRAVVSRSTPDRSFEFKLVSSGPDWLGTLVGFELAAQQNTTQVHFHHTGWPEQNEHYRISCYCWAMYLRVLRRFLEHGETVPYERRLNV
jgi:uncharacterized protein YndB with AHSA1/START domain